MAPAGKKACLAVAVMSAWSILCGAGPALAGPSGGRGGTPGPAGYRQLAGSVPAFTGYASAAGRVAGSRELTIQVWLAPDLAGATSFATAVSTPGSPLFRQYLSPASYRAHFAAGAAGAAAVESWLAGQGFSAIQADPGRSYVRATAAVARIEAAFRTQLLYYRPSARVNAGPYPLYANAAPVSVPASLAGRVLGVTGIDNAAPIIPLVRRDPGLQRHGPAGRLASARAACSQYYGQHKVAGLPRRYGSTAFPTPVCGYSARQVRAAYRAGGAATGNGQTVALVELGLTKDMLLTLRDYARVNGLPAPSASRYTELSLGRGTACGDVFDVEEQLDVEAAYAMAPGASQVVVGGDTCDGGDFGLQGLFNADVAVLNGNGSRPLASIASNSWEADAEAQAPALIRIENAYLVRAAAEGVGMYFASGDNSGVESPSSNPFAIAVGGTTLGLGKGRTRLFETGWSSGLAKLTRHGWSPRGELAAAGGGPSRLWRQPGYQRGVVPPALTRHGGTTMRSVPDISADADPFTGLAVGTLAFHAGRPPLYHQFAVGGTSLATPLVAGLVAAAQQGQGRPFGFLNPVIYRLAGTSAVFDARPLTAVSRTRYGAIFCDSRDCAATTLIINDDQVRGMDGYTGQVTLAGYDNMTGVGTPNGPNFIRALRRLKR